MSDKLSQKQISAGRKIELWAQMLPIVLNKVEIPYPEDEYLCKDDKEPKAKPVDRMRESAAASSAFICALLDGICDGFADRIAKASEEIDPSDAQAEGESIKFPGS